MSNLCLNDNLVSEYLKYISNSNFDKNLLKKLLKYIQPFLVSKNQHKIFLDPAFPMQINNDPLLKIIADCSEDDLVKATSLKIQLIENNPSKSFVELSINPLLANSEKLDMTLGATFENSTGKDKANKHIKDLLSDAKWINKVNSDRYFCIYCTGSDYISAGCQCNCKMGVHPRSSGYCVDVRQSK